MQPTEIENLRNSDLWAFFSNSCNTNNREKKDQTKIKMWSFVATCMASLVFLFSSSLAPLDSLPHVGHYCATLTVAALFFLSSCRLPLSSVMPFPPSLHALQRSFSETRRKCTLGRGRKSFIDRQTHSHAHPHT
jgi:hypothetical protein